MNEIPHRTKEIVISVKEDRYYYMWRGNGYGPFKTYIECVDNIKNKVTNEYPSAHIFKGKAIVKNKELREGTKLIKVSRYDKKIDKYFTY